MKKQLKLRLSLQADTLRTLAAADPGRAITGFGPTSACTGTCALRLDRSRPRDPGAAR